ncbi:Response regulator receiver domain-containing protein [Pseudomonas sp. ok272]|uniref:response regulator n=1 Tax=unclassified Pseudomonas TaxID=196821 RepID=UPI0008C6CFE1|nr:MULTISPECIES: response regulator [unclassified Pseudomonas]SEM69661.1 Response regulator receiver domain-containing protein [Pseudomonas sp. ok272]SFM58349.1 Response regulator receiver domain-containing protein [Pseudomonas sp. ok602]
MPNKALRILIADEQHFHRMKIERCLNSLGYYRIAPVQSLEELLSVVEYGCEPFDLVILNATLCKHTGLDPLGFCQDNPQIRHAMVYDTPQVECSGLLVVPPHNVTVCQARVPDQEVLASLMDRVDPAHPCSEGEFPRQLGSMRA